MPSRSGPTEPDIYVRNLQRKIRIKLPALQAFAGRVVPLCFRLRRGNPGVRAPRTLFVLLISDRRMAALHHRFLGKSGPTDVITFDHGEIFISIETALRQARQFKNSLMNEIQLYIVHGLLHLRGFDDSTPAGAQTMDRLQKKILSTSRKSNSQRGANV